MWPVKSWSHILSQTAVGMVVYACLTCQKRRLLAFLLPFFRDQTMMGDSLGGLCVFFLVVAIVYRIG